jgi:hypothetical protein
MHASSEHFSSEKDAAMTKPADERTAKARALKVVRDLDLTQRGYMGEEYFANELVAFAESERSSAIEECARIAENHPEISGCDKDVCCGHIAAAIRALGER